MRTILIAASLLLLVHAVRAQDTFSIVAADSVNREVGSAGASCVDLALYGITDAGFLGDLLPDTGAINTQASYLASNQVNARARMRAGDTPAQIIAWLTANDAGGNPSVRQYGITGFTGGASAAAHTGASCINYKNHITGSINGIHYSIQGNILLGQYVLDSMEQRFRNAQGDIACRLMAAMQGANMVGADTRCAGNNTSSLFAFIKVAQPTDAYGSPSFTLGVITQNGDSIEPVDSLQTLFNAQHTCLVSSVAEHGQSSFSLYPNPAGSEVTISGDASITGARYRVTTVQGKTVRSGSLSGSHTIPLQDLDRGIYLVEIIGHGRRKFVKH